MSVLVTRMELCKKSYRRLCYGVQMTVFRHEMIVNRQWSCRSSWSGQDDCNTVFSLLRISVIFVVTVLNRVHGENQSYSTGSSPMLVLSETRSLLISMLRLTIKNNRSLINALRRIVVRWPCYFVFVYRDSRKIWRNTSVHRQRQKRWLQRIVPKVDRIFRFVRHIFETWSVVYLTLVLAY